MGAEGGGGGGGRGVEVGKEGARRDDKAERLTSMLSFSILNFALDCCVAFNSFLHRVQP